MWGWDNVSRLSKSGSSASVERWFSWLFLRFDSPVRFAGAKRTRKRRPIAIGRRLWFEEARRARRPDRIFGVPDRSLFPARFLLWSQVVMMGALWAAQAVWQKDVHAVNRAYWGFDFNDFFLAAQAWKAGLDPYAAPRFVTPPLGLALFSPFAGATLQEVRPWIAGAFTLSLLGASALLSRVFVPADARRAVFWTGAGALFLGFPYFFLLDRLNVDGFVMAFVALFVWAIAREEKSPHWPLALIAGAALSLGVGLKLYPALLILPLLLARRWRVLGAFAGCLAIQVAWMFPLWVRFVELRLRSRSDYFVVDDNGSLANTMRFFGDRMNSLIGDRTFLGNPNVWIGATLWVLLALLGIKAVADARRVAALRAQGDKCHAASLILWYLPFMVSVPKTVYHYEFVGLWLLLPAISALFTRSAEGGWALRFAAWSSVLGLALSQMHTVAWTEMLRTPIPYYVPGLGLFLLMLASTAQSLAPSILRKEDLRPRKVAPFKRAALSFLHRP